MTFSEPRILLVLAPILLITMLILVKGWNKGGGGAITLICRTVALSLLVLSLAGPHEEIVHESNEATLLVDISDSVDEAVGEELLANARKHFENSVAVSVVPFAGSSGTVAIPLAEVKSFSTLKGAWGRLDIGKSDISEGLRRWALGRGINSLILTDGYETQGSVVDMIPELASSGARVFPLVPEGKGEGARTFQISQLHAPLTAPSKKSVDVLISLQNSTGQPQIGMLEVRHDTKVIYNERVSLGAGKEAVITAQSDPSSEGIKEVTATLRPEDRHYSQSSRTVYLSGEKRDKVLLVSGSSEDERFLRQVFSEQSYQLTSLTPSGDKVQLPDLGEFSSIILNNASHQQLSSGSGRRIEEYVKGGGGLIMVGGNRSFGLGGYKGTPVEEALPVEMLPPQTEKKRINVAVQLVLDKSRSMSFDNKIEFVKEASRQVVGALKDEDYMGLIGFDTSPFIVVKMGLLGEIRELALDRISRIYASGRTNLLPAIEEGRRALDRVSAGRKHMIILTDGKIPDGGPFYVELVKQLRLLGITVSTVMLGEESEEMLREMAQAGGGGYYQTTDPNALPRIFVSDIKVSTGEKTLKERSEYYVRRGTGEVRSTSLTSFPPVRGYVQTKAKSGSALELVTYAEQTAEPLLVSWSYGKGRSVAFTSDANGRWSDSWIGWPKFQQFWSEVLDWIHPEKREGENVQFDLRYSVDHGALALDLAIFSGASGGQVTAEVKLPDGSAQQVAFSSVATGRYRVELPRVKAGRYEVHAKIGGRSITPVAFALSGELFGEQKGKGFNVPFLEKLAGATSGKVNPSSDDLLSTVQRKVERVDRSLLPLFFAFLLLIAEIWIRELRPRRLKPSAPTIV